MRRHTIKSAATRQTGLPNSFVVASPGREERRRLLGLFTRTDQLIFPLAFYALGTIVCLVQALVICDLAIAYFRMVCHAEY